MWAGSKPGAACYLVLFSILTLEISFFNGNNELMKVKLFFSLKKNLL